MTVVKIEKKTSNGKNIENVEIEEMNVIQIAKVAKGISKMVKLINENDKVQNIAKTFKNVYEQEQKNAEEYYKEQKKAKKKPEEVETYNIGEQAVMNTGAIVWNELLDVLSDLLIEAPEVIYTTVAHATGIKVETIQEQKFDTFMTLLETAIEENDINGIVERLKKSKGTYKKLLPMFNQPQA